MTRRIVTLLSVGVLALSLLPAVAQAHEGGDHAVYLSLGTSLAAGTLADDTGASTFDSNVSYTDQLYRRIKGRIGGHLHHDKLGCPGETTDQMLGGLNSSDDPSACVGPYATGSQIGDALLQLQSGNVALVTIDMGANDILQAQGDILACGVDEDCVATILGDIAANVALIVGTLRAAGGYDGPILAMNYYNPQVAAAIGFFPGFPGPLPPDAGFAFLTDALAVGFNGALAAAYGATGAQVVDVYSAFNAGDFGDDRPANGVFDNVDAVCVLTSMCPDDGVVTANIHPNKKGYRVIAKAFLKIVKTLDFS